MKTLSSPITTQAAAAQSGWCELYDIYLPTAIVTPFGTTATLRLCTLPGGLAFFTPKQSPEPVGTQGNAQGYTFWVLSRQAINGSSKLQNDKLTINASNVTGDFANLLDAVDWDSVSVTIRKVSTTITSPTADDCSVIFSGSVDSAKITLTQLSLTLSNDLGSFQVNAPRENMHSNCRFQWADDQCTALRFLGANYKTKTVGSSSTTTNVKCSGLTEDTGSKGSYGTDLVAALSNGSITASSNGTSLVGQDVGFTPFTPLGDVIFFPGGANLAAVGDSLVFAGGALPTGVTAGTTYYITQASGYHGYAIYTISLTQGGTQVGWIGVVDVGNGNSVSTGDHHGYSVKAGSSSFWQCGSNGADWGTNTQGYWQIPDAQAGLKNETLTPYLQFDFGSDQTLGIWQFTGINSGDRQDLPRLVEIYSATNGAPSSWGFMSYFELPPLLGGTWDCLIPGRRAGRYWRICVRSRWSTDFRQAMFKTISAYTGTRNWWQNGIITFASNTTTTALQGVSRAVQESYSGELICAALPVAPVAGDTFTIERGCPRTFNGCACRSNTENFGGFNTLPYVQITTNP